MLHKKLWLVDFDYPIRMLNFDNASNCYSKICLWHWLQSSVTRLDDLLHFGQLFKACNNNYIAQIARCWVQSGLTNKPLRGRFRTLPWFEKSSPWATRKPPSSGWPGCTWCTEKIHYFFYFIPTHTHTRLWTFATSSYGYMKVSSNSFKFVIIVKNWIDFYT